MKGFLLILATVVLYGSLAYTFGYKHGHRDGIKAEQEADGFVHTEIAVNDASPHTISIPVKRNHNAPPEVRLLVPGPNAFPLADGAFTILFSEPTLDRNGNVNLKATLKNESKTRIASIAFIDHLACFDNFGNKLYASWSGNGSRVGEPTLYPQETLEMKWYFGKPVPGSTVHYQIGLNGYIADIQHTWADSK